MSRRDPKVSLNNRQNDALTEFENFLWPTRSSVAVKKKFLLANKHITKLNSTLSVRIEELQAQISTLYVENLRLRASEIALAAQLKKEQEKSRKILADAEAATSNLSKHLGLLRQSFGTPSGPSPKLESHPVPKARRPAVDTNTSPMIPRLSRAPNIPGINEDDEVASEEEVGDNVNFAALTLTGHRSERERLKTSTLPVLTRVASPPPLPTPLHVNLTEKEVSIRRKGRRQSGLLSVNTNVGSSAESERGEGLIPPRAASPAFGSPIRREAGLAEDDEERKVGSMQAKGSVLVDDNDYVIKPRKEKKEKRSKQVVVDRETTPDEIDGTTASRARERRKRRDEEVSGLKDVTNSPRSRAGLPLLDTHATDRDVQRTSDTEAPTPSSAAASVATSRTFLSTPMTTPATTPQISQVSSPRCSSPIPPASMSETDGLAANGRERRTRKSVNYAEPKLNTKMRKPDPVPPPITLVPKKRISTSLRGDEAEYLPSEDVPPHSRVSTSTLKPPLPSSSSSSNSSSVKRKKSRSSIPVDEDDDSDGTQADAEYGCGSTNWVDLDSRRRTHNGVTSSSSSLHRTPESDDARRHSLAV
ncbi:hypothetical protein J3A83DRAFT_4360433 [Scleroderma citrinum]